MDYVRFDSMAFIWMTTLVDYNVDTTTEAKRVWNTMNGFEETLLGSSN